MDRCTRYLTSLSFTLPVYKMGRLTCCLHSTMLRILQEEIQKAIAIKQLLTLGEHFYLT